MVRYLFVCTGNTCRSPMAEAIFNAQAPHGYHADSAGAVTRDGKPISENSRLALSEIGIVSEHTSRLINEEMVKDHDRIVGLTSEHTALLKQRFPAYADKIVSFPIEVSDPYGCDLATYRRCREQISEGIRVLLREECRA